MSDTPQEEGCRLTKQDFKRLEPEFKDLLQREERGELTEQESSQLNEISKMQGQPVHAFLWCMWHMASVSSQQEDVQVDVREALKANTCPREPHNEADLVTDDTEQPWKNYCLTDEELKELTSAPEGQAIPFFDKLWLRQHSASQHACKKGNETSKESPSEQRSESAVGSGDTIEIMTKAAEKCGQSLPVYLASLLVSTLGMPGLKLDADTQAQNVKQKVARKKRMAVTLKDAAQICGRSTSAIKKWERGESTPDGWPGRGDLMVLKAFANTREGRTNLKKAIKNAARIGDMDKISRHVAR